MTPNEIKALDYVRGCITRGGFSPTLDAIAAALGLSGRPRAHRLVSRLVASGHLRRAPGKIRGLELPDAPDLRAIDSAAMKAELARRGEISGAFSRPERRASNGRAVTCAADCCAVEVSVGHAFCLDHWRAISTATQRELLDANRAARASSGPGIVSWYQDAFTRACDEANARGRG